MDLLSMTRAAALCATWIVLSVGLIHFNKYLISPGHFPHAMVLTMLHMFTTFLLCNACYWALPSWFPSMEETRGRRMELARYFLPLGLLFSVALFSSNKAYLFCTPAFLQFIKEAHLAVVFVLSCATGLAVMTRSKFVIIVWILAGCVSSVRGEVDFRLVGFLLQVVSSLTECGKNVLGEWVMKASSQKLDPLTYTMFMSPVCFVVLAMGSAVTWNPEVLPDLARMWPLLLPNACLAFAMNLAVASLIKECSAVAFVLAGIVKDVLVVLVSARLFQFTVTAQQYMGFVVCVSGVFFWSYAKISPDAFLVRLWEQAWCTTSPEAQPLLRPEEKLPPDICKTAAADPDSPSECTSP